MNTLIIIAFVFLLGLGFGWIFFRSERSYQEGWRDGERHARLEAFRKQVNERDRYLINPETGEWYDK